MMVVLFALLVVIGTFLYFLPDEQLKKLFSKLFTPITTIIGWFKHKKKYSTIKPSGVVSTNINIAAGIHPPAEEIYVRRNKKSIYDGNSTNTNYGELDHPTKNMVDMYNKVMLDAQNSISGALAIPASRITQSMNPCGEIAMSDEYNSRNNYAIFVDPYLQQIPNTITERKLNRYKLEYWDKTGNYKTEYKDMDCNDPIIKWNYDNFINITDSAPNYAGPDFYIIGYKQLPINKTKPKAKWEEKTKTFKFI